MQQNEKKTPRKAHVQHNKLGKYLYFHVCAARVVVNRIRPVTTATRRRNAIRIETEKRNCRKSNATNSETIFMDINA